MTPHSALGEHIEQVQLVDHHAHGYWVTAGDRTRFENGLNEANTEPIADFDSAFDTQLGFAIRAHCAPILGLPKHADPDEYWDHRISLGDDEVARRLLRAAGISDWLIETGFADGVAAPAEVAELSGTGRTR